MFLIIWYFAGIIVNRFVNVDVRCWLLTSSVILLVGFIGRKTDYSILFFLMLMISLGGLNHSMSIRKENNHISHFHDETERNIVAVVESSESYMDGRQKIIVRDVILNEPNKIYLKGKALIRIKNGSCRYFYGDTLVFNAVFREPSARRNPGEFDYRSYLANHHIFVLVYLEEKQIQRIEPRSSLSLRRFANQIKYGIQDLINRSMKGESAAILQALLIGVRGEISDETEQAFIDSGAIHVLAVSGLHVGYVTLAFWVITGFLRLPLKPRVVVTIFVLVLYVMVVDIKPSVMRAVIMASMVLVSKGWEKQVNVYNSLAAAALIQTLIDPMQLFDMGFQLSFTAVFSIVYIYQRIESLLPENIKPSELHNNVFRYVFQMFLVSLAALIGTVPITIFYFNRIPIISILSNLVIIPLIGVIGALGFAQVILGSICNWFNIAYAEIETVLLTILQKIVTLFSGIPGAYIPIAQISVGILILLYIFIFLLLNADKRKIRKGLIFGLLIAGNIVLWKTIFEKPQLTITFLDVGQGDAALIQLPDKRTILVDTGDRTFRRDYGELVVAPYLEREGIREIDLLILTHPHSDHIGGAPTIIRRFPVDQIWESDIVAESGIYREIHALADSLDIPVLTPNSGDMVIISDNLKLYFLHPSERFLEKHQQNYNDGSLVFKLVFGEISILFTGDAEEESENYLCFWDDFLKSTIIKVPHHGSSTSSIAPYVKLVNPEYTIVSVGLNNKFKHPAKSTLQRYRDLGSTIYRTDIEHAVQFKSNGKIVKVIDWE
ncbi:MAG: DNA internalization-related competence protein ComEC/Rec2 [Candidatus Marinimicrobia bacterium]|nr:DNA internalization-related competence protein ComEC/Rec2 [Candidatus Neomarinimicrobiota bacterium]